MRKSLGKLFIAALYVIVLVHRCKALVPHEEPRHSPLRAPVTVTFISKFDAVPLVLTPPPAAAPGGTTGDVELFRARFASKGLRDPATELDEELHAGLAEWYADCAAAQEWRTKESGNWQWVFDPAAQQRVDGIVARLTPAAGLPGPATVEIFHGPANAFTPGGDRLFVSDAMLELMDDEELSAVLAHEMGHVIGRHPLRQRRLCEELKNVPLAQGAEEVEFGLATLLYSRICEAEADALGVVILNRAGMGSFDRVTHMTKMVHGAPDTGAMKSRIAELEKALEPLETEEDRAEEEFNRTKSEECFERLAHAKAEAQKVRSERDAYRQALSSSTRKSEWTHPDFSERIPRWQEAYAALNARLAPGFFKPEPSKDLIVRYVLDAAGKLWNF